MSEKPSYLGLLNAVSNGESQAECYLTAWAEVTPDAGVRQVISTVALREGEHGKAFAKRLCELGYTVLPREDPKFDDKMAIASSRTLTDREKFEKLGLEREVDTTKPDIFSRFFDDSTIDIQTGALLGRYIAEERDSGRMLRGCYDQLCAAENGHATSNGSNGDLGAQLSRIEDLLEKLVAKKR
jgi:rubrerythrin